MKKIAWLLMVCAVCLFVVSCSGGDEESAESENVETAEVAEVAETAPAVNVAGMWEITGWHADEIDQMEMWGVETVMVEFQEDGTLETQLTYKDGGGNASKGTWERDGDKLMVHITGGGDEEGDHPFERTREFTIDELSAASLTVRAEIPAKDTPIVLTYKAKRLP